MKKICLLTTLSLSLMTINIARAYPPNNAAVIYYRHAEFFSRPDDKIWDQIRNLRTSNDPVSDETKAFMKDEKIAYLLQELQIASEIEFCDWGLDFSQGFAMQMPILNQLKNFHYLLLADSTIQASEGNISEALEVNLINRRMAQHVSNDTMIGFLVSCNITRSSDKALGHLLSSYPLDEKKLVELKNKLLWKSYRPKPILHPLMMEKEVCLAEISIMTPERYKKVMAGWKSKDGDEGCYKRILDYLSNIEPASRERAASIFSKYYDNIFTLMAEPYTQAYKEIRVVSEEVSQDAERSDDALLPAAFIPAISQCYSHAIAWKTSYDATLTALDVYITAAKTGKLPEELPKSTYIDHFSKKPFTYEVTEDGFTLKCQQEDLSKKTTHEFTYKLPK